MIRVIIIAFVNIFSFQGIAQSLWGAYGSLDYYQTLQNAEIALNSNRLNDAVSLYTQCINYKNLDIDATSRRAFCYARLKKYDSAIIDYKSALDMIRFSDSLHRSIMYVNLADVYMAMKDTTLELTEYNNAAHINNNLPRIYEGRGNIYFNLKKYMYAIIDFQYAKGLYMNEADSMKKRKALLNANSELGFCYLGLKKYSDALSYFVEASKDTLTPALLGWEGQTMWHMGKQQDAIHLLTDAINLGFENDMEFSLIASAYYFTRCTYHFDAGDTLDALFDCDSMIQFSRLNSRYYLERGKIKELLYGINKAKPDYEQALFLSTGDTLNPGLHAVKLICLNRYKDASDFLDMYFRMDKVNSPNKDNYFYYAACAYSMLQITDEALECLDKSLDNGFNSYSRLKTEPWLKNIRGLDEFSKILTTYHVDDR